MLGVCLCDYVNACIGMALKKQCCLATITNTNLTTTDLKIKEKQKKIGSEHGTITNRNLEATKVFFFHNTSRGEISERKKK